MMKKINYLLILASVFALNLKAQDWSLKLSSNVEIRSWKLTSTYEKEERSLGGASIVLTKVGQIVAQTTSDGSGDFTIMVPPNGEYILTVSYPGYNTKRFSVNTNDVPAEFAKDNYKPTFSIGGFIMAKPFPGIDYSGLQQPLVRVQFMPKKKLFDHDDLVTDQGLAIVSKIAAAENALIQSFCSTNKAGDVALAKPDCPLAKTLYEKAMTIIPGEQYPVQQLAKVGECLKAKDDAAKKAAEDAANKTLAEKAAAEKAKTDAEAKALADKKAKEEAEANKVLKEKAAAEQANAEKAAKQKAENDRLEKEKAAAEKLAAEKAAKEKAAAEKLAKQKEGLAKSQAEDEAEAKAIEEKRKEKEAREKEAMAKAKAEDEAAAKALAEKKAAKEKEAKEKSAKEKEAMAKAKAEDEAEAKALEEKRKAERLAKEEEAKKTQHETKASDSEGEMAKGNSKYSTPQALGVDKYKVGIKKADDYFKMKRWAEAKTAYEDVLKIRAGDPYATSKLEIVNKNLSTPK
jgi:hypothetical protein